MTGVGWQVWERSRIQGWRCSSEIAFLSSMDEALATLEDYGRML